MNLSNPKLKISFVTPTRIAVGVVIVSILGFIAFQSHYLSAAGRIENIIVVEPQSINFGFVLPEVSQEKQLAISLSDAWLQSGRTETVGYFISKNPKCQFFDENGVCVEYFSDLCSYIFFNPGSFAVLTRTNPTSNVGVVLNSPRPLPPELQGQRLWCDLWVQVASVSSLPLSSSLVGLFESFPVKTAHAFEAHIVQVSAVLLGGSPAQVAVAPAVETSFMKIWAKDISAFRHDPLNDAALSTLTMVSAVLCLAPEPILTKLGCVGSLLTLWGAKEIMWASYDLLSLDPPREDFDVIEHIKPAKLVQSSDKSEFSKAIARYTTSLSRHSQLVDAVRITNERLQGAVLADKGAYMLLQSQLLYEFLGRLAESNIHHQEVIKQILHQLPKIWNDDIYQKITNWANEGLSDEEKQTLLDSGLSEEEIAQIEEIFGHVSGVEQNNYLGALQAGLQKEIELMQNALPTIKDEVNTLKGIIEELEDIVCSSQLQTDVCF